MSKIWQKKKKYEIWKFRFGILLYIKNFFQNFQNWTRWGRASQSFFSWSYYIYCLIPTFPRPIAYTMHISTTVVIQKFMVRDCSFISQQRHQAFAVNDPVIWERYACYFRDRWESVYDVRRFWYIYATWNDARIRDYSWDTNTALVGTAFAACWSK